MPKQAGRRKHALCVFAIVVLSSLGAAAVVPASGRAATICVGGRPGCVATLQAALASAADGDTIRLDAGTFTGGVAVTKSVRIAGAGPARTTISGGGPVLTIGVEFAATEPTVSISRVTITGGMNTSVPDHAVTQGGGVRIPQAGSFPFHTGATVTISDSVVSGNTVASQQLLPPGFCGSIGCSFASGGGIFNEGNLTLVDSRVSGNQAGPGAVTVFASGAGIENTSRGVLTVERSVISDNTAAPSPDTGLNAAGAGIDGHGVLSISDSIVSGNAAKLTASSSIPVDHVAVAGGILVEDNATATITRTRVRANSAAATASVGTAVGVAAGIDVDGTLTIDASSIDHNTTTATSPTLAISGGAFDVDGSLTIRNSAVVKNQAASSAPGGTAIVGGGGIANFSRTTLDRTVIAANNLTANGTNGSADGGGVWNGDPGDGRKPNLSATDSIIAGNTVSGTGVQLRGGGLFNAIGVATLTLSRTLIVGNHPDQCSGC
jgi:hypothetical protein